MQLAENQILIKVQYSGINRGDLSQKAGNYPAPAGHSSVLGLEVYGVVSACGIRVSKFAVGDEVFALVNGGGYGELCIAEEALTLKRPDFLTAEECASIPEVYATVLLNFMMIGQLQAGQTVLIHAGASGIGLAAIQVAKLLGVRAIATVRSSSKKQACIDAGADIVLVQDQAIIDYATKLKDMNLGVDLTLNPVGGTYINQDLHVLALSGKLINIGLMAGHQIEIDLALVLRKNLQLIGSTLRNKPNEVKAKLITMVEQLILPAIKSGNINIVIDKVFAIDDVQLAHEYMEQNQNIGKVLLKHA